MFPGGCTPVCQLTGNNWDAAVTIAVWRRLVLKRIVVLLAGVLISIDVLAEASNPYPNELKGLKFYARYLSPLRPLRSDTKEVVQVLGSDQGLELKDWKVVALIHAMRISLPAPMGLRMILWT